MSRFFEIETREGIKILKFTSFDITMSNSPDLKKELDKLLKGKIKNFIFNFKEVKYITSLFIAILVFFAKKANDAGGDLRLCEVRQKGIDALHIAKMDTIFKMFKSQEDAIRSFRRG